MCAMFLKWELENEQTYDSEMLFVTFSELLFDMWLWELEWIPWEISAFLIFQMDLNHHAYWWLWALNSWLS